MKGWTYIKSVQAPFTVKFYTWRNPKTKKKRVQLRFGHGIISGSHADILLDAKQRLGIKFDPGGHYTITRSSPKSQGIVMLPQNLSDLFPDSYGEIDWHLESGMIVIDPLALKKSADAPTSEQA